MKIINLPAKLAEKGIEISKPVIRDFASVISSLINIDANRDGKIDTGEGFGFGAILFNAVLRHYANLGEFLAEMKDTDSAERKELITVFKEGFDLQNDEVEFLIEDVIAYLENTITEGKILVDRFRNLGKQAA